MSISQAISDYGFPIVATIGLLYMIYFIWGFITNNIKKKLSETSVTLIALIDRIRVLDTVIDLRDNQERKNAKTQTK